MWNQWVAEDHTERHAGSQLHSQELGMFAARLVSAHMVRRLLRLL